MTSSFIGDGAGSSYWTVPSDVAHIGVRTIVVYCQVKEMPAVRGQVIATSDDLSTVLGMYSIELNADGSLRTFAYDGTSITPVTSAPGTIVAGTAFRLALTVDASAGMKVYLDNAELTAHAVPTLTAPFATGAHQTAGGRWSGATDSNWLNAAFDELRFYDRALAPGEIYNLGAATSVTLPDPPVTGDFMVPRVDLFLTNDDMSIPAGALYASPTGTGVGGTTEGSAGDLQTTVNAAGSGTVVLLQGYYDMPDGIIMPVGTSAAVPTTIMAKPNEWAAICQDIRCTGQLPDIAPGQKTGLGVLGTESWTLFDGAKSIWRIPYNGTKVPLGMMRGCWFEGGIPFLLQHYPSLTALQTDIASAPQTWNHFWWSGFAIDGGFLYLRFDWPNWFDVGVQHSPTKCWPRDGRYLLGVEGQSDDPGTALDLTWFVEDTPGDSDTGKPAIPATKDPNDYRIYFAPDLRTGSNIEFIHASSGSFIRIGSGINTIGYDAFNATGKGNIEVHRGCHFLVHNGLRSGDNITFHRCRNFTGQWRLVGSMAAYKFNQFLSPPFQAWEDDGPPWYMESGTWNNITHDNCSIYGYEEILLNGHQQANGIRFVHCTLAWMYDELWQGYPTAHFVEWGHCYFRDAPINSSGGGERPASNTQAPNWGTVVWHHCISDARMGRVAFDSRTVSGGSNSIQRANDFEQATHKWYNVTQIFSPDGASPYGNHDEPSGGNSQTIGLTNPKQYGEVFNSIMEQQDNKRYFKNEGGISGYKDHILQSLRMGVGHSRYRNRNLYSRKHCPDSPGGPGFAETWLLKIGNYDGVDSSYDWMRATPSYGSGGTAFYGSAVWTSRANSQSTAAPDGRLFEQDSTDESSDMPSITNFPADRLDYRPANLSAVTAIATPPSQTDWWTDPVGDGWPVSYGAVPVPYDMAPSPWKGAVDPNGSLPHGTVGVQNP